LITWVAKPRSKLSSGSFSRKYLVGWSTLPVNLLHMENLHKGSVIQGKSLNYIKVFKKDRDPRNRGGREA